jgi:hypothetical protein
LIFDWGTNKGLVVSGIRVDIVVFPFSLHEGHFIWRERLELLLPLRSVSDNVLKPAAESRFSVDCVLAAQPTARARTARAPMLRNPVNRFFIGCLAFS